jgi:hypothetical protein
MVPSRAGGRRCAFRDSPRKRPRRRSRAAALAPRAGRTRGRSASSPRPERHHRKPIRKMSFGACRAPARRSCPRRANVSPRSGSTYASRHPASSSRPWRSGSRQTRPDQIGPASTRWLRNQVRPIWRQGSAISALAKHLDRSSTASLLRCHVCSAALLRGAPSAVALQRAGRAHGKPRYCGAAKDSGMSAAIYPE